MSNIDVIRAWKDEDYRNSLSEDQRALLPDHPAGFMEIDDQALEVSDGGNSAEIMSLGCCNPGGFTTDTCWHGWTVCGLICPSLGGLVC